MKIRELGRLSKPGPTKSVNVSTYPHHHVQPLTRCQQFRNVVPGSLDTLLTPTSSLSSYLNRESLVDPTHPAAFLPRYAYKTFPKFRSDILRIQAYPKSILAKPELRWPDPPFPQAKHISWQERVETSVVYGPLVDGGTNELGCEHTMSKPKTESIDMALASVLGRKVHKKAVVRNKITSKLKTAISLIVVRGADADANEKLIFTLNPGEDPQWILPGVFLALWMPYYLSSNLPKTGYMYSSLPLKFIVFHTLNSSEPSGVHFVQFLTAVCPWSCLGLR